MISRPAAVLCLLALCACDGNGDEATRIPVPPTDRGVAGVVGEVHLQPGPLPPESVDVRNPFADDPRAVLDGEELYLAYNCGACHGARGGGGMGPPLRDETWIYGGDAVSIYRSIMEGRPQGMPTWQGVLPDEQAWKIVAYIHSMGSDNERPPRLMPPANRTPGGTAGGAAPADSAS